MSGKFLLEITIGLGAPEHGADARHQLSECGQHDYFFSSCSTRPITPATRSQFRVAAASCFLPAFEIE